MVFIQQSELLFDLGEPVLRSKLCQHYAMMSELAFELRGGLLSAEVESRNFIPHGRMADQMTDDVMTDDHTDHTLS